MGRVQASPESVKNRVRHLTLAQAKATKKLRFHDIVIITDRANGYYKVVLASGVSTNEREIVKCNGASKFALVAYDIKNIAQIGCPVDGVTNITPYLVSAYAVTGDNQIDFPYCANGYVINKPVAIGGMTCIFNGADQLKGDAALEDVNGVQVINGAYQGYIFSPEMRGRQIEVVCGTIRQQQPRAITGLTRPAGTTAIVNEVAHGREVGDYIVIQGASQSGYNGTHEVAQVDDANTYRIVVHSGLPSPATGVITVFGADVWEWIKDSTHEPIGVDDSKPVRSDASGYGLVIPFTKKNYSKVLSSAITPDETLAGAQGLDIGASVATSAIALRASLNKTITGRVYYNGSGWKSDMGTDQGEVYTYNAPHPFDDISYSGGNLTFSHSFCLGDAISIHPHSKGGVAGSESVVPFIPVEKSVDDNTVTLNFNYVNAGALDLYTGGPVKNLSFRFTKNSNRLIKFDGSDRSSETKLFYGNIWFIVIMQA